VGFLHSFSPMSPGRTLVGMVGASGFEPPTSWSRKKQSKNPSASFGVAWEPEGHSFSPSVVPKLYGNWWPHCARARPQSVLIDKFGQVSGARRLEYQFADFFPLCCYGESWKPEQIGRLGLSPKQSFCNRGTSLDCGQGYPLWATRGIVIDGEGSTPAAVFFHPGDTDGARATGFQARATIVSFREWAGNRDSGYTHGLRTEIG